MGAELVDEANLALGVAERDQALAEQLHAHRRAIGLGQFFRDEDRDPEAAHELPHGLAGAGARHEVVVFLGQHGFLQKGRAVRRVY
jgi:hypothetical protein